MHVVENIAINSLCCVTENMSMFSVLHYVWLYVGYIKIKCYLKFKTEMYKNNINKLFVKKILLWGHQHCCVSQTLHLGAKLKAVTLMRVMVSSPCFRPHCSPDSWGSALCPVQRTGASPESDVLLVEPRNVHQYVETLALVLTAPQSLCEAFSASAERR